MGDLDLKRDNISTFSYSRQSSVKSTVSEDAQALSVGRTQGDGMENIASDKSELKGNKIRLGESLIYHPTSFKQLNSNPPVTPSGTVVKLVPQSTIHTKKEKYILNSLESKKPKFVPYEPYKAAINPIIPKDKKNKKTLKNNADINKMVSQLAALNTADQTHNIDCDKKSSTDQIHNDKFKKEYESEIQKLKEENSQLENQLKFQAQVNAELKKLLVAAVGEDLENRVHLLTEDKLQLARALLNSAKHLSTHQEQTEWLAGQCEVWRSKFLASSLMVEELAKWKAALCQRTTDLQESVKRIFEEHNKLRDTSLRTYRTLSILRENFAPTGASVSKRHELASTNIIDLAEGCSQLSELLKVQLLSGMDQISLRKEIDITGLEMKTVAEKTAEQLLMSPNLLMSGRQDAACSAVMGAAVALSGQMFLPLSSNSPNIACCAHCSGDIKQI